jgi:hypothetical protein
VDIRVGFTTFGGAMVIVMLQAVKKMHTEFFRVDTVNSPEFSFEDIPFFCLA